MEQIILSAPQFQTVETTVVEQGLDIPALLLRNADGSFAYEDGGEAEDFCVIEDDEDEEID